MNPTVDRVPTARAHSDERAPVVILNAKRVLLTEDDVAAIVEIEGHPHVQAWLYDHVPLAHQRELREYHEFFRKLPRNRTTDIFIAKCDGRVVGFLGLWRLGAYMEHIASIGVSVHPNWWGHAVATHLLESAVALAREHGVVRLEVETLSGNAPMRRVAENAGFQLEGVRKNRVKKGGTYHDEVAYALLL